VTRRVQSCDPEAQAEEVATTRRWLNQTIGRMKKLFTGRHRARVASGCGGASGRV
jgi:hypothetical protein